MQTPGPAPREPRARAKQRQQKPQHRELRRHTPGLAHPHHAALAHRGVRCWHCSARHSPQVETTRPSLLHPVIDAETGTEISLPVLAVLMAASAAVGHSLCAAARRALCGSVQKSAPRLQLVSPPLQPQHRRAIAMGCGCCARLRALAPKREWESGRNRKRSSIRRYLLRAWRRRLRATLFRLRA